MYSIPFHFKIAEIYKAQCPKEAKQETITIELSKSISRAISSKPPQEESKRERPDTRHYAAPAPIWCGLGGSGGD